MLGQVKLAFKSTSQQGMIVTRSMQLTVQKTTRKFKTLECQLLINHDGERTSISSRVAELDQIMPRYFGVSEAILDSVIFCHQDESLWPMSEPAALKKKFDEIFEAMKYTKAIENLKNLRKVKNSELGELRAFEIAAKDIKDKAERVRKRSIALEMELDVLRDENEKVSEQMEFAQQTAKEKHEQKVKAIGLVDELKFKVERRDTIKEDKERLESSFDELAESDAWLESTLAQYEERMAQYREQAEDYRLQNEDCQRHIADIRRQMSGKQSERGQHLAEKERYDKQVQARVQLVKKAAHKHSIRGYEVDLDDQQIRDFIDKMQKHARDKDRELERLQSANEDELNQSQAKLTEIESRRSTRTNDKVTAKQSIALNDRKLKGIQRELDLNNVDDAAIATLQQSQKALQVRLQQESSEFGENDWDGKLRTENSTMRDLESEAETLRAELVQSTKLAKDRAQLEFLKDQAKEKQQKLDTLKSTYGDRLRLAFGGNWNVDSVERDYLTICTQRNNSLEEAKKQQEGTLRASTELEYRLRNSRSSLAEKRTLLKSCHDAVLKSIIDDDDLPLTSIDDYEEEFDKLQEAYDDAQAGAEGSLFVSRYYKQCLDTANKNHCQLCQREFADVKQKSTVVNKIQTELQKAVKDDFKAAAEELKILLQKAIAARSKYDTYQSLLKTDIPALEKEIASLEREKQAVLARLEQVDDLVAKENRAKDEVDSLSKVINNIAQHRQEIMGFDTELSRIASQQKLAGSSRSIEEIEERGAACQEQLRLIKSKVSKLVADRDAAKAAIAALELELSSVSRDMDNASHQLDKKRGLVAQIEEIQRTSDELRERVNTANKDLEDIGPLLSSAKVQHEEVQQRGRAKVKSLQTDKEKLFETVHEFKSAEDDINQYLDRDGPGKLVACERSIKNLENEQIRMEQEVHDLNTKSAELQRLLNDGERTKRSIEDNINYRRLVGKLESIELEIVELESCQVTDNWDRLAREAQAADKHYQSLLSERGRIIGEMNSKDQELAKYIEEWDADYKDAGAEFRKAHIKVETTKAAVEDLGKCMQAVDAAIMKYHSAKMEEINRVAGELWQSTYQGTDVDTIMIRSEAEEGTKKRGYNYRVVMVKQDAEMDMRGRCSAGQKVLACIIIRLALAECFGVNCGVCPTHPRLIRNFHG